MDSVAIALSGYRKSIKVKRKDQKKIGVEELQRRYWANLELWEDTDVIRKEGLVKIQTEAASTLIQ